MAGLKKVKRPAWGQNETPDEMNRLAIEFSK
jgi:hypothetical protein